MRIRSVLLGFVAAGAVVLSVGATTLPASANTTYLRVEVASMKL
jgi:hypothetical protein